MFFLRKLSVFLLCSGSFKRAFTLIELLTSIAIIGILIALISPSLRMSHKRAKIVQCMNNLKEIGNLITLYEMDEGKPPTSLSVIKTFFSSKVPDKIFSCPSNRKEYVWNNGQLDKTGALVSHSDNPHGKSISLSGLLSVEKSESASPPSP